MEKHQKQEGQAGQIRSGLQWLGSQVREVKFGTIRGVLVRDGTITKGADYSVNYTRKPCGKNSPRARDSLSGESALQEAMKDLARDAADLRGEWNLKIKVGNGIPLSWDRKQAGCFSVSETK